MSIQKTNPSLSEPSKNQSNLTLIELLDVLEKLKQDLGGDVSLVKTNLVEVTYSYARAELLFN